MIEIKNLNYKYKNGGNILNNINLEIKEGEILSIIGRNGSGKSTLLKIMAGIIIPKQGDVLVDKISVKDKKLFIEIRKKVGIVFQNPDNQTILPTVIEDIRFLTDNLAIEIEDNKISEALEKVEMKDKINSDINNLSLGQKQRVNIASMLVTKPKYIIFDEATSMIDSLGKERIYNIMKRLKDDKYSIIYVTNNINEIMLSDRIVILENGKIKEIIRKEELLEKIYVLEESEIKIPEIVELFIKLREKGIDLKLKEWTIKEIAEEISRVCSK